MVPGSLRCRGSLHPEPRSRPPRGIGVAAAAGLTRRRAASAGPPGRPRSATCRLQPAAFRLPTTVCRLLPATCRLPPWPPAACRTRRAPDQPSRNYTHSATDSVHRRDYRHRSGAPERHAPAIPHAIPCGLTPATTHKPQNFNDLSSHFEIHSGELHAKFPPVDERQPQGLQTHIHTFNMRASAAQLTCLLRYADT